MCQGSTQVQRDGRTDARLQRHQLALIWATARVLQLEIGACGGYSRLRGGVMSEAGRWL